MSTWKIVAVAAVFGLLLLGVGALGAFYLSHRADAKGAIEVAASDSTTARQAAVIDSLTRASRVASVVARNAVDTFHVVQVRWRAYRDTLTQTVTAIVHDTLAADSTRIRELAALALATARKADSAIAAGARLASAADSLARAFTVERAAWGQDRATLAQEVAILKRQGRRWGLVAGIGYGAVRSTGGVVHAGPVIMAGIGIRY